jgi:hypothetical protein
MGVVVRGLTSDRQAHHHRRRPLRTNVEALVITDSHRADLEGSGLTDETISLAGLYSAPERQVRDILGYGAGAGLVIPYPDPKTGVLNGYARVKLDKADENGKRYRSPLKQPNHLYIPRLLDRKVLTDTSTPIWFTEGEKKALKACQEGLACIAASGVWSWKTRSGDDHKSVPLDDLDAIAWRGRTVYVVFDSDAATNPQVKDAEFALSRELARRGAKLMAVRLPGGPKGAKVGLDDYLLTHSVDSLCAIEPTPIRNPDLRTGPAVVEYHELLTKPYAEPPAIVGGGVLPRRGFVVIGGPPKVGKSSLVLNLAFRRALGLPWLGFPTTPGRTLILQAEVPEHELQMRLRLMADVMGVPVPDKHLFFVTHRGIRLDRHDGLQLARKLLEQTRVDCFWVDPLARFYGGDENSAREVGRLVGSIDALIQDLGVAVGVVHHTSKPSADDARQGGLRLRGSSALFAAADSVLVLDRDADAFKLAFELRHGREPEPMRLTRTEALWFEPAGPPEDLLAVAQIVAVMPLPWGALVGAVKNDRGVSKATAERMVGRAIKARLIGKNRDGHYIASLTNRQREREAAVSSHA